MTDATARTPEEFKKEYAWYREAIKTLAADRQSVATRRGAISIRDAFLCNLENGCYDQAVGL